MVYESALMCLCVPKMCIDSSGQVSACASTNKKVLKKRTDEGPLEHTTRTCPLSHYTRSGSNRTQQSGRWDAVSGVNLTHSIQPDKISQRLFLNMHAVCTAYYST